MTTNHPGNDLPRAARRHAWLLAFALVAGTFVCYWPVRHYDYVSLDDNLYVTEAPLVQAGITWPGFKWAFTSVVGGNWNPLVWLSHMLDIQMFGPEAGAGGHHVTNVLLHLANVLLLFGILRAMTGTMWRSALAAALFAWHPAHVESVAWISERKDVLSTLFWLLTMWAYRGYTQGFRVSGSKFRVYYALALVFFVLGLMSKPMLVTLPVVLLLMDWWPLKRIGESKDNAEAKSKQITIAQALMEKIPFFVFSFAGGVAAIWSQQKSHAVGDELLGLRLENAVVSCAAYVGEFFWPAKLAIFYPFPDAIPIWQVVVAALILVMITLAVIWARKERPYLAAGWLWFLITLLPVIGLVHVGMQSMADRYTYVPYIGLGLMLSWGLADLAGHGTQSRAFAAALASIGLAVCVAVTMKQVTYWRSNKALYEHALAVTRDNIIAHGNLGSLLEDEGDVNGAMREFREEVRLRPNFSKPYNDLGKALALQGKIPEAYEMFSNAVRLDPQFGQARRNLGTALLKQGHVEQGLAELKIGVSLEPDNVDAHRKMAEVLIQNGKAAEAVPYCEMVAKTKPRDAHVRYMLGESWLAQKHYEEAVANLKEAMRLAPNVPPVMNAVAWIYATCPKADVRNGAEAVRLAERACQVAPSRSVELLDTLAAAYAEAGRFADAIKTAEETIVLAEGSHDEKNAGMERQRLELYRAGKAYHEEP